MSTDAPEELFSENEGVLYAEQVTPQHGILGFTLRELLIVAVWLIGFVTSFLPIAGGETLWMQGVSWLLPLGVPTIAVFLIVLRRFSPDGIRRVGSLGIDQFASVAFSVGALWWLAAGWAEVAVSVQSGVPSGAWLLWVQFGVTLALVVLTVFAPFIPRIRDDFRGRLITLAHRTANPVRPVIARPRPERPAPAADVVDAEAPVESPDDEDSFADGPLEDLIDDTTHDADPSAGESIRVTEHASGGELGAVTAVDDDYVPGYARSSGGETASQPFWALAPTERDVVDEQGAPLFTIGPNAWALVIEDRGGAYVVRHDDGRVGYLHEISDITRG